VNNGSKKTSANGGPGVTHHIDLSKAILYSGSHPNDDKACVMELVALFAGEPKTDHPKCTSPVLTAFAIAWNDGTDNEDRQALIPYIPRLVGTSGDPAADEIRAWLATDWLVRTFTPVWLREAGLVDRAAELEALPELTSTELATAAQAIIEKARDEAYAARDAAGAAARAAVLDAARDAARDAAWDAVRAAAWAAAGAAAWDAAWDAARDAAWDAARAAAWAAARAAAWDAARAAVLDAARDAADKTKGGYDAKYVAARKAADAILKTALDETVKELHASAFELFSKMCDYRSPVPARR
jgi:hypothetical protein